MKHRCDVPREALEQLVLRLAFPPHGVAVVGERSRDVEDGPLDLGQLRERQCALTCLLLPLELVLTL